MTPDENTGAEQAQDAGAVQNDTQVNTEAVATEETEVDDPSTPVAEEVPETTDSSEEKLVPAEDAEPETTLDEEIAEDVEVVGANPVTSVDPETLKGDYLAIVNSTGFTKGVYLRADAIAVAQKGGYSLREATEEEVAQQVK